MTITYAPKANGIGESRWQTPVLADTDRPNDAPLMAGDIELCIGGSRGVGNATGVPGGLPEGAFSAAFSAAFDVVEE